MRLSKLSLRLTLVLSVGAILLVSGIGVTLAGWATMRTEARQHASQQARALMEGYGQRVGKEVGQAVKNASVGAAMTEGLVANPDAVNRDQIGRIFVNLVRSNPDIIGMTPAFATNALDGRDSAFIGHPYSDAEGRFVPYFYWGPDKTVMTDKLLMTVEAGIDAWYTDPMTENRTLLTAPYLYPINGKETLMASAAAVVRRNGKPVGVVTTDLSLADLSSRASNLHPFGQGVVSIIGGDNLWVANPDVKKLGKGIEDKGLMALMADAATTGYAEQLIPGPHGKVLRAASPISFPGTADRWWVVIEAPEAVVMAGATKALNQMLLTALCLLVLASLVLWFGSRLMVEPVQVMTRYMGGLAAGDYEKPVPYVTRSDEIGQMAHSVEVFRDAILDRRQVLAHQDIQNASVETKRRAQEAERQKVIAALGSSLRQLADGDLTTRIADAFPREYDALRADFNAAIEDLNTTIRVIVDSAGAVRAGADEINSVADDLSRRTEQQAASLEETAAALDEITATVRMTAEGAQNVRHVVGESKAAAEQSSLVVVQAVEAMSRIESSSREISQIIGVIDEIAFQTNLLALNAGVEAARAGTAGAGFAVVAQEVRALAQRSAEAAKQIKGLIQDSTTQVASGVNLVDQAGKTLKAVAAHVTNIDGLVQTIAASAQEQASGLHQVNTAMNQMDSVTQQNAAMVEETNAASHTLSGEADHLSQLVARFRTSETASKATQPAAERWAA